MSTTFVALPYVAAAPPTSADPAYVRLAAGGAVVCVVDSADDLPLNQRNRSYSDRTCCSSDNLSC